MRTVFLSLFCAMAASVLAQEPSASEQLKGKIFAILRGQVTEWMTETTKQRYPQATAQDIAQGIDSLMPQVETAYGALLTLPEAEASQLLTTGSDDKANMVAMQKDIELWKTVQRPMPALYKNMQEKVIAGKIKGGLELELIRRISEFHLKQLGKMGVEQPGAVRNQPDTNQQKAYIAAFLTPISFWGKVVDEKGNPVPDASVKLGANDNPIPLNNGSNYERKTDANGLFSITGVRGIALSVNTSKEGYYTTKQSSGLISYVVKGKSDIPVPTSDNPSIFVLRRMGETVPLFHVPQQPVQVFKDGRAVEVNLQTGANGPGGAKVECWTQDQTKDAQGRYDWRCRISVPSGGLIERIDSYAFEAPTTGYQAAVEISMPRTAERWNKGVSKEYFAKLPGGRYARFSFELTTAGHHFFVLESYVNPTAGDRNLEYDARKSAIISR